MKKRRSAEAVAAVTRIFLDENETLLRLERLRCSTHATPPPARPRLGVVSFLHRFGSGLNRHAHLHAAADMLAWEHSGFSIDASVRITLLPPQPRVYHQSLEHLLRSCARPPFALERLCVIRDADGRITRIRYVVPRHWITIWAANRVGPGRKRKSTQPGASGVIEPGPFAGRMPVRRPSQTLALAATALPPPPLPPGEDRGEGAPNHEKPRSHDTSRIAWAKLMARLGEEFPLEWAADRPGVSRFARTGSGGVDAAARFGGLGQRRPGGPPGARAAAGPRGPASDRDAAIRLGSAGSGEGPLVVRGTGGRSARRTAGVHDRAHSTANHRCAGGAACRPLPPAADCARGGGECDSPCRDDDDRRDERSHIDRVGICIYRAA